MQIGLFEIVNDKIVPGETTLAIPVLAQIKKDYKKDYLNIYAYLFYMSCWDSRNVYLNVVEEERSQQILCDLELDISTEEPLIIKALELCQKLYETPAVRGFKACKVMIDQVAVYLETTTPTSTVKFSNVQDISKLMKELPDYIASYNKINEMMKEEQSKIRGNKKIAIDQADQLKGHK